MIHYRGFDIVKGTKYWHLYKGEQRIREKFNVLPDAKEKVDEIVNGTHYKK